MLITLEKLGYFMSDENGFIILYYYHVEEPRVQSIFIDVKTRTHRNSLISSAFHFIDISFPFSEILLVGIFVLRDFSLLSL